MRWTQTASLAGLTLSIGCGRLGYNLDGVELLAGGESTSDGSDIYTDGGLGGDPGGDQTAGRDLSDGEAVAACNRTFASVGDVDLCSASPTECRFYAHTENTSCETICEEVGATCLRTERDDSERGHCVALTLGSCTTTSRSDAICSCSR